jgi:transcriptional regulator with XRE-family HTH domain
MPKDTRTEATRALGRRIREERVRAGLSRQAFAQLIQTSRKMITNYETGWAPSPHRLAQIARALNRSLDYLQTGLGERNAPYGAPSAPREAAKPSGTTRLLELIAPEFERVLRCLIDEAVRCAVQQIREELSARPPAPPPRTSRGRATTGRSRGRGSGDQ